MTVLPAVALNITAQLEMMENGTTAPNQSYCSAPPKTLKDQMVAKITLGFLYCCAFCLSLCGNSLVIYVVITNRSMQSVTNLFITNLAISDVVVSISSLWITPMYMYLTRWIWGGPACFLFTLLQGGSIFISTFTLTSIAVDRYVAIVYPFKPRLKIHVCLLVIASIWVAALLLVAPLVLNTTHTVICGGRYVCYESWSMSQMRSVYGVSVLVLQYGFPFIIIVVCYSRLSCRLRTRSNSLVSSKSIRRQEADIKRKQRLNKMLILMVVIFALCWFPINFMNILRDADNRIAFTYYFPLFYLMGHLSGMSATCWNPILYAWMNDNFRREFQAVLPCFSRIGRVSQLNYRGTVLSRLNRRNKDRLYSEPSVTTSHALNNDSIPKDPCSLQNANNIRRHTMPVDMDGSTSLTLCASHECMQQRIQLGDGSTVFVLDGKGVDV